MIGIAIFCLLMAGVIFFVLQGIIVPSSIAINRIRLFALRDQLRDMSLNGLTKEKEFEEAQRKINNLIRLTGAIDVIMLASWEAKLRIDKELAERINRRQSEFDAIASPEVKSLIKKACAVGINSVKINSLGLLMNLLPIMLCIGILLKIRSEVSKLTNATEYELTVLCPA
jgi:hypothetical protein